MTTFVLIIVGISIFAYVLGFIIITANKITYLQRLELISKIYDEGKLDTDLSQKYNQVSYNKHLFYTSTFRDAMKLYE